MLAVGVEITAVSLVVTPMSLKVTAMSLKVTAVSLRGYLKSPVPRRGSAPRQRQSGRRIRSPAASAVVIQSVGVKSVVILSPGRFARAFRSGST